MKVSMKITVDVPSTEGAAYGSMVANVLRQHADFLEDPESNVGPTGGMVHFGGTVKWERMPDAKV